MNVGLASASTITGLDFPVWMESLRDAAQNAPVISPRRYADVLHVDLQTLADYAKVHRNTLTRAPESESVQRYLREAIKVIRAAFEVSGDMGQALYWYRNEPLQPFDYRTAEALVAAGRADDIVRFIDSFAAGAAG